MDITRSFFKCLDNNQRTGALRSTTMTTPTSPRSRTPSPMAPLSMLLSGRRSPSPERHTFRGFYTSPERRPWEESSGSLLDLDVPTLNDAEELSMRRSSTARKKEISSSTALSLLLEDVALDSREHAISSKTEAPYATSLLNSPPRTSSTGEAYSTSNKHYAAYRALGRRTPRSSGGGARAPARVGLRGISRVRTRLHTSSCLPPTGPVGLTATTDNLSPYSTISRDLRSPSGRCCKCWIATQPTYLSREDRLAGVPVRSTLRPTRPRAPGILTSEGWMCLRCYDALIAAIWSKRLSTMTSNSQRRTR